jgi:hypothetical protein
VKDSAVRKILNEYSRRTPLLHDAGAKPGLIGISPDLATRVGAGWPFPSTVPSKFVTEWGYPGATSRPRMTGSLRTASVTIAASSQLTCKLGQAPQVAATLQGSLTQQRS